MPHQNEAILHEIQRSIGRIEGHMKGMADSFERRQQEHDSLASRVSTVERRQSFSAGSHSVLSSVAGALAGGVAAFIGRHVG